MFIATILISFVSMSVTLWLAFYLLARGFPNRISMRAVLSLFFIALFFLGTYISYYFQQPDTSKFRAAALVASMVTWYSVTFQLLSSQYRQKFRWMEYVIYTLAIIAGVLLITTKTTFFREQGNHVFVAHLENSPVHILYGLTQLLASLGIVFNLTTDRRIRYMPQGRFFFFGSIFPALAVFYGIIGIINPGFPLPRLVQDLLVFSGISLLAISVARHQSLLERRTIMQDFPASLLMTLALVSIYIYFSLRIGLGMEHLASIAALAITTHSIYDLGREFIERLRMRNESRFRRQLRLIDSESDDKDKFQAYLQEGLDLLCSTLNTASGFVALRQKEKLFVMATRNSVRVGSDVANKITVSDEIARSEGMIPRIEWTASAFEGQNQIALVGVGRSKTKLEYSNGELDLLAEFADLTGTVASMVNAQPKAHEQIGQLAEVSYAQTLRIDTVTDEMIEAVISNPDDEFVKVVEEGLRKYSDYVVLGQSPLAEFVQATGSTHIERGKQVQKVLYQAIETLRPVEPRPEEPLPRVWYNYVVLHDAYVKGVINREVMARLYISEGTFHRTRRNAVRGVARWLVEESKKGRLAFANLK